jgi:hypothetical protein
MAKHTGLLNIRGTIANITFYEINGVKIVKSKSSLNRKRIETDPSFKRTRENMSEFGASATIAKTLRVAFHEVINTFKDTTISGRLTAAMKQINLQGAGERGQRDFQILNNNIKLEEFLFSKSEVFNTIFKPSYIKPTTNNNRNTITWQIPKFNPLNSINAPKGATHFKLILIAATLSNYNYNPELKTYLPVESALNGISKTANSNIHPLKTKIEADVTLQIHFNFTNPLPTTVAIVNAIGIVFYQEINQQFYQLTTGNAMKIASVV